MDVEMDAGSKRSPRSPARQGKQSLEVLSLRPSWEHPSPTKLRPALLQNQLLLTQFRHVLIDLIIADLTISDA